MQGRYLNSACITHIDSLFELLLDRINKDIAKLSIPCLYCWTFFEMGNMKHFKQVPCWRQI